MKENIVRVERRTENSRRAHFNLPGDWRPRLVVWLDPESEEDTAWGGIVADALRDWASSRHLHEVAFRQLSQQMMTLPEKILRAFTSNPPLWAKATQSWYRIDPGRLDDWKKNGHSHVVHLYADDPLNEDQIGGLLLQRVLDRATLLPYGKAICQFGIGEPLLEIAFADEKDEADFREKLTTAANARRYLVLDAEKPFLSRWLERYREALGARWDEF